MRSFQLEKETGEKVRKGWEEGTAQDVSVPFCYRPESACILIFVLCFPWILAPQRMLGGSFRIVLCFQCLTFCFAQHQVWVTFPDPVRIKCAQLQWLAWVLLTHSSLPRQETEAEPCNHTWPVYEVTIPWLRQGIWLCMCAAEAITIESDGFAWTASQSSYIMYLQTEFTVRTAVLLNSCTALLLFVVCLAFL